MLRSLSVAWDAFFPHPFSFPLEVVGSSRPLVNDEDDLEAQLAQFLLFTYRSGFAGIASTTQVINSDQGWGCLLRSSQMVLAHCLLRHATLRTDTGDRPVTPADVLPLFLDEPKSTSPFSVHNMIASVWDRKMFRAEYWSPSQGCEAIRRTVDAAVAGGAMQTKMKVVCSSNGTLIAEDVRLALRKGADVVMILATIRAGVARQLTQGAYLEIERMMGHSSCLGFVGGVPERSYYFFGHSQTQLTYLDPHQLTQPALRSIAPEESGVVVPTPQHVRCVSWSRVDTSLFFAFAVTSKEEWADLQQCLSTSSFLCVQEKRTETDYVMQQAQGPRSNAHVSPLQGGGCGPPLPGQAAIASLETTPELRAAKDPRNAGGGDWQEDEESWEDMGI